MANVWIRNAVIKVKSIEMKYLLFLAALPLFFASCSSSLRPFTSHMLDNNEWTIDDLSGVQFYLSEDIVIWREAGKSHTQVENGKIRFEDGRQIEEIVFKEGTPGTYLFSPKRGHFAIGFEDDPSKYLIFGPSSKVNGQYVLLAKEWHRNYGKVSYGTDIWFTHNESAFVTLLVDVSNRRKTEYRSKTVSGRKVN